MPEDKMSNDAEVVRHVLGGRQEPFGVLVQRYSRVACSVAFAHLGNRTDTEDAVQEAFIQAYQGLGSLREPEKFGPWLLSIVRHVSINAAKRRAHTVSLTGKADAMNDLRKEIEQRERERMVESLLGSLEEQEREILTLHYFAGMSTAEIAEALDLPRETVKKRLQRTRAGLATPELVAACAPDREDEDRLRKRVMAALLLLPLPAQEGSQSAHRVPPVGAVQAAAGRAAAGRAATTGLPVLVKVVIALLGGAVLVTMAVWFFTDRTAPRSTPAARPVPQTGPSSKELPNAGVTTGKGSVSGKSVGKGSYQGK